MAPSMGAATATISMPMVLVKPQAELACTGVKTPLTATAAKKVGSTAAMMVVAKAELAQSYITQPRMARLREVDSELVIDFAAPGWSDVQHRV